jgi:hypothetical protein
MKNAKKPGAAFQATNVERTETRATATIHMASTARDRRGFALKAMNNEAFAHVVCAHFAVTLAHVFIRLDYSASRLCGLSTARVDTSGGDVLVVVEFGEHDTEEEMVQLSNYLTAAVNKAIETFEPVVVGS